MIILQTINVEFHREPLSTILYGIYWCCFFVFWTPIIVIYLIIQMIYQLYMLYNGCSSLSPIYDPKNQAQYNMAIIITGCDTGFGKDIAINAAQNGYTVFAGCYNYELSKQQFTSSSSIISFPLDVTNDDDVQNCAKLIQEWLHEPNIPRTEIGRQRVVHALINNAGINKNGLIDWLNLNDYETIMDVNFYGMIRMIKAFLPIFKDQAIGKSYHGMRIINISSMAGLVVSTGFGSAYSASKHAVQALTTSLRIELKTFHIAVSSVNPSFHTTPLSCTIEMFDQLWNHLPDTIREQYGPSSYEKVKKNIGILNNLRWNASVVTEQIINQCLKSLSPPYELIIGSDARYLWIILRMLPPYIREFIMNDIQSSIPYPECMMTTTTTKSIEVEGKQLPTVPTTSLSTVTSTEKQ